MKEILDSEIESSPNDTHSRKACWYFVANLLLVLSILIMGLFSRGSISVTTLNTLNQVFKAMILVFTIFGLLGFRYAMLSMTKKEKWTYIKIVGVIGNLLFFVIIILLFAANINDVVKSWGGL